MGMSLCDFEQCTPSEFQTIFDQWQKQTESLEHASWERTRFMCMSILQPYSKKVLTPKDVMAFPWDNEQSSEEEKPKKEELTREEFMARYRAARDRFGLK